VFAVPVCRLCRNEPPAIWQYLRRVILRRERRAAFGRGFGQKKTAVSSAIGKNGTGYGVFDFLAALPSLVFSDFPAGRLAKLRRCLFLGPNDAPAKRNLDQPGEFAVKPFRLQRLQFLAVLRHSDPSVLLGI
jgi:hypothetical protein